MRWKCPVAISALVLILGGIAAGNVDAAKDYLMKHDVPLPTSRQVVVCHGFDCKFRTVIALHGSDIARLTEILARGRKSPAQEIRAIGEAVAWFERRIGSITGTKGRTPRAGAG